MQTEINHDTLTKNCRIAVLSKNMLEVADLTDFFERRGETGVLVLRDPTDAIQVIGSESFRPSLILFAYDDATDGAHACWHAVATRGISTIRIGDGLGAGPAAAANDVTRPFTSEDIESALSRLRRP